MYRYIGALFLLMYASVASASVEITEIMYDLEGADDPHEWVEIYNDSGASVDLSGWRFNDGSNHALVISDEKGGQGSLVLDPYTYAILADNANDFLSKYTTSVSVIDTVMSLGNTADVLQMKNSEGVVVDEVLYTNEQGAAGDGNSLQKENAEWVAKSPTPGIGYNTAPAEEQEEKTNNDETVAESTGQNDTETVGSKYASPVMPTIWAYAGERVQTGVAGARMIFRASVYTKEAEEVPYARYTWAFGDGATGLGKESVHTYYYPGEYMTVLNASSGIYAVTDRIKVVIADADVSIVGVGDDEDFFVKIQNDTEYDLDLFGWIITAGENEFVFPKGTYVFAQGSMIVSSRVSYLEQSDVVTLLYPDRNIVHVYNTQEEKAPVKVAEEMPSLIVQEVRNFSYNEEVIIDEADDEISSVSLIMGEQIDAQSAEGLDKKDVTGFMSLAASAGEVDFTTNNTESGEGALFWCVIATSLLALVGIYMYLESGTAYYSPGVKSEADLYKIIEIDSDD